MKRYSVHYIYIGIILLFLGFLTIETLKTALDPAYDPPGRYIPRALVWYFCVFLWWACLVISFRVEISEDNSVKTFSILKRDTITPESILSIKENILSYTVIHTQGITRISNLIDGITNVKSALSWLYSSTMEQKTKPLEKSKLEMNDFGKMLFKIGLILFLIGFALFVELDHLSRISK